MKFKTLLMAFVLSISSITAFATTTDAYVVTGSSFNAVLDNDLITISSLSDITGSFLSNTTSNSPAFNLLAVTYGTLSLVDASTLSVISSVTSTSAFSFQNIAAGTYYLAATGTLASVPKPRGNYGSIYAEYSVTAVPEPKTSGMFLAGLGIIGFIASRRKSLI